MEDEPRDPEAESEHASRRRSVRRSRERPVVDGRLELSAVRTFGSVPDRAGHRMPDNLNRPEPRRTPQRSTERSGPTMSDPGPRPAGNAGPSEDGLPTSKIACDAGTSRIPKADPPPTRLPRKRSGHVMLETDGSRSPRPPRNDGTCCGAVAATSFVGKRQPAGLAPRMPQSRVPGFKSLRVALLPNEAAQESNLPSDGLRRPAGFEDGFGCREFRLLQ